MCLRIALTESASVVQIPWRTVKPLFSDKVQVPTSLTLLENNNLISNDKEVAEVFNNYFANITDALGIKEITENISSVSGLDRFQSFSNRPLRNLENRTRESAAHFDSIGSSRK